MNTVQVRLATAADLSVMSSLWQEHAALLAQQDTRWKLLPDARAVWERAVRVWLVDADLHVAVSHEAELLTGYAITAIESAPVGFSPEKFAAVRSFAVDAHHFSSGAARLLLESAREWCRNRGVTQIVVDLPKRAAIEQAFWRAQGGTPWMERLWIPS